MKLADLLPADAVSDARLAALEVAGVSADSRAIKPGDLFVAVAGAKADGLEFLPQALAAGAAAVMAERPPPIALPASVPFIKVDDARRMLARAAAMLFPRQPVAAFTRQIWTALGHASASIGTVGLVSPQREIYGSLTTPDPVELHRSLDQLAREGVTHLAIEASSHGLDQRRLDGVHVAAGGFTNLSRDHLDYHPTLEAYLAAKLRLFEHLIEPGGAAVIAADHEHADVVAAAARRRDLRLVSVGRRGEGIRLLESRIDGFAQALALEHAGRNYRVRLPLPGEFQVENALVAAGLVIATGGDAPRRQGPARTGRRARRRADLRGLCP